MEVSKGRLSAFRSKASRWLSIMAIAALAYSGVALTFAWWRASKDGSLPQKWGVNEGNHGPWHGSSASGELLGQAMLFPFIACCIATLAYFAERKTSLLILMAISLVVMFSITATHFWLID